MHEELPPTKPGRAPAKRAEDLSVAKANEAIAIRPKRGRLTLLSRRIYNALLFHSQRQGIDRDVYELPLAELIGDAYFNSRNTELLKAHLRDMQSTTIEWSTSSTNLQRWVSCQLLGTVSIAEGGRGRPAMVSWRYPEEIKERLVKPLQYTRVLLEMSAQMRSYTAAVLYEIGARYLTSPGRLTMREDVLWWAAVLTGRSDLKEVEYRFFKRDVINKALAEVEALCDEFSLELIEHKRGRKIEEIQFRVVPRVQQRIGEASDQRRNQFDLELVGKLIELGMKQEDAEELYATTDEGQLRSALEHVRQRMQNKSLAEVRTPVAYLKNALKKGYTSLGGSRQLVPGDVKVPAKKAPINEGERVRRLRELWENHRTNRARDMFAEMHEPDQDQLKQQFEKEQLDELAPPIAAAWRRQGIDGRLGAQVFFRWLGQTTWPGEPSDGDLLAFALKQGVNGIAD